MQWICFMVYQILRQAHLKEVGPTQNQETMTLHFLTTLDLIEACYVEGPHEEDAIEIAFG